jgi:dihydrofolate synthase/folylpolyglutamate synthase
LDATNVINPLLSIITNIGLDHTEHLGHTLADIAREKAGIIKKGIPCLIGSMALKAEEVMEAKAESSSAKLILARSASRCRFGSQSFEGITIHLDTQKSSYNKLRIRLPGGFQAENARLAVLAVEELRDTNPRFTSITPVSIRAGLRNIRRNTGLRGRFEVIQKEPAIIIDVAHNPDGIDRLVTALRTVLLQKVLVVFGVMKDKDCERMLRRLKEVAKEVITVSPAVDRALSSRSLFNLAVRMGTRAVDGVSVKEGIAVALGKAEKFDRILITGSHYVVGEAIQVLEGKSRLVSRQTLHKPTVR